MRDKIKKRNVRRTLVKAWNYKWVYIMLLPVIVYFIVFRYAPMYGTTIAFKDYNIFQGVFKSEWVGFSVFQKIFANKNFWSAIKNTFLLNFAALAVSFPLTIIVSLVLDEVRGVIGLEPVPFLSSEGWWIFTYVICNVWKEIGWGTIIYLAALTGVDESLYEAAYLDGASKFQRLVYITVPSIKSVIVTMLILNISKMMSIGLDAPLLLGNSRVMGVSEVISTYTYRIEKAQYSQSTAIGLFQSVVNIVILLAADKFAKAIGEEGII